MKNKEKLHFNFMPILGIKDESYCGLTQVDTFKGVTAIQNADYQANQFLKPSKNVNLFKILIMSNMNKNS